MRAFKAQEVADYLLAHQTGTPRITHLKLQKLLYYAQAIALAVLERPLFHEDIEHWDHGPVVRVLYPQYKQYDYHSIPMATADTAPFDKGVIKLLSKITQVYGQYSAASLRDMTHQEDPWNNTQDGQVISWPAMKQYFQKQPETYERFATFTPEEVRELARTPEVIEGIRVGMEDRRAGRMIPLENIRDELGI